jgi:hypothetical protein
MASYPAEPRCSEIRVGRCLFQLEIAQNHQTMDCQEHHRPVFAYEGEGVAEGVDYYHCSFDGTRYKG